MGIIIIVTFIYILVLINIIGQPVLPNAPGYHITSLNSIMIKWKGLPPTDETLHPVEYIIESSTGNGNWHDVIVVPQDHIISDGERDLFYKNIVSLKPGVNYYFRITITFRRNQGAVQRSIPGKETHRINTEDIYKSTNQDAEKPEISGDEEIYIVNRTESTVTLKWAMNTMFNSEDNFYQVFIKDSP